MRLLIFILAASVIICAALNPPRYLSADFYHWWVIPKVVNEYRTLDFYRDEARTQFGKLFTEKFAAEGPPEAALIARGRVSLEPTGTPFLYAVLAPFSGSDYLQGFYSYVATAAFLFFLAIWILFHVAGFGKTYSPLLAGLTLLSYHPIHCDLWVGNVNSVQLLGQAAIILLVRRATALGFLLAGAIVGLEILFKPNFIFIPAVLMTYFIWSKQWRVIAQFVSGATIGGLAAFTYSVWAFQSFSPWHSWIGDGLGLLLKREDLTSSDGNMAPAQILFDAFGVNLAAASTLFLAMGLAVAVAAGYLLSKKWPRGSASSHPAILLLAVGLGGALLCSSTKLTWAHYQVALLPLIVLSLRYFRSASELIALFAIGLGLSLEAYTFGDANFTVRAINALASVAIPVLAWRLALREVNVRRP